jgi:hypothetical protein
MYRTTLTLASSLVLLAPTVLRAATPTDAVGHWEGAIQTPQGDVRVTADVDRAPDGTLIGAFSNPAQHLEHYPFANVVVDGATVRLEIKTADPGVQAFAGTIGADGKTFTGDFLVSVYSVPFALKRTGPAELPAPPSSPAIDAALTGAWAGTLEIGASSWPLTLTLANETDGTARGYWSAGAATPTPVAIVADGRTVTLSSSVTPTRFSGTLSQDGTAITGTMSESGRERPVTFNRQAVAR